MRELDSLCQQTQWWINYIQGLSFTELFAGQIGRVVANRVTQRPQVDSYLVGSAGFWDDFQQRCPIGKSTENSEISLRRKSLF
jgi:hypothetical protein